VNLETRRHYGTFFTHSDLGKKVLSALKPNFTDKSIVYDPACGASNLLISVADFARKKSILNFEKSLRGTDIHAEFIEASKLRLQMNQLIHGNIPDKELFEKNFLLTDGLLPNEFYQSATHVIVNPSFNQIPSGNNFDWAKGKVSAAAIFIDKIIQHSNCGVSILAILEVNG
jgi:type I restriction-modification system DNA methylase subunit